MDCEETPGHRVGGAIWARVDDAMLQEHLGDVRDPVEEPLGVLKRRDLRLLAVRLALQAGLDVLLHLE
jgi:hypothetical protein